ncbi:unnamed protein product [Allacma fusca]|uniref:Uncharacterized protein n=1 Tax=Allacma fusca TaxID=39272 RepID=A0A8J2NGI6_9HEXA|nr:unnamed protein product [Allacma fusca]
MVLLGIASSYCSSVDLVILGRHTFKIQKTGLSGVKFSGMLLTTKNHSPTTRFLHS